MSDLNDLADRLRHNVAGDPRVTEKQMFGGVAFLLNGHMYVTAMRKGALLVSVGRERFAELQTRPGARPMVHGGRTMTGFVEIEPGMLEDDEVLLSWIELAQSHVGGLPPKPAKS